MEANDARQPTHSSYVLLIILAAVITVAVAAVIYFWKQQEITALTDKVTGLTAAVGDQRAQVANWERVLATLPNKVEDASDSPVDLIAFLATDNTQCYKDQGNIGYYKILAHANNQFAKMRYGCVAKDAATPAGSPTYILAKKVDGKWQLISPTNEWLAKSATESVPSCTMVNDNRVSKLVTPQCFIDSQSPTFQAVTNP